MNRRKFIGVTGAVMLVAGGTKTKRRCIIRRSAESLTAQDWPYHQGFEGIAGTYNV